MFELKYRVVNGIKKAELGTSLVHNINRKSSVKCFVHTLQKILLFRKEQSSEIERIQKNDFLFTTSENIYTIYILE